MLFSEPCLIFYDFKAGCSEKSRVEIVKLLFDVATIKGWKKMTTSVGKIWEFSISAMILMSLTYVACIQVGEILECNFQVSTFFVRYKRVNRPNNLHQHTSRKAHHGTSDRKLINLRGSATEAPLPEIIAPSQATAASIVEAPQVTEAQHLNAKLSYVFLSSSLVS